jgi:hypothetical protein
MEGLARPLPLTVISELLVFLARKPALNSRTLIC